MLLFYAYSLFVICTTAATSYFFITFLSKQSNIHLVVNPIDNRSSVPKIEYVTNEEIKVHEPFLAALSGLLWDLCLLLTFIAIHSFFARQWFKNVFDGNGLIKSLERSVYVVCSDIVLQVLILWWQPVYSYTLWNLTTKNNDTLSWFFTIFHGFLWFSIYCSCIHLDLWEMIGIKQIYYHLNHWPAPIHLKTPELQILLKNRRHPSFILFSLILWGSPTMRSDRALAAIVFSSYMLFGFSVTENDYEYLKRQFARKMEKIRSPEAYEHDD